MSGDGGDERMTRSPSPVSAALHACRCSDPPTCVGVTRIFLVHGITYERLPRCSGPGPGLGYDPIDSHCSLFSPDHSFPDPFMPFWKCGLSRGASSRDLPPGVERLRCVPMTFLWSNMLCVRSFDF